MWHMPVRLTLGKRRQEAERLRLRKDLEASTGFLRQGREGDRVFLVSQHCECPDGQPDVIFSTVSKSLHTFAEFPSKKPGTQKLTIQNCCVSLYCHFQVSIILDI